MTRSLTPTPLATLGALCFALACGSGEEDPSAANDTAGKTGSRAKALEFIPRRAGRRTASALVLIGLAGITAISLTVSAGDDVIRRGLLPILAVLSALTIQGAVSGHRVLKGALETGPVQFLGSISYPVYLVHWPVAMAMSPERMSMTGWPLIIVRFVVSVGLGYAIFRWVERPMRHSCLFSDVTIADLCKIFFFNDTATTEIYTRSLVGSVRCV